MSNPIAREIELLEKTLDAIESIDVTNMDFNTEAALIRHFEVIGGIGKLLSNANFKTVNEDFIWKVAIKTRDKLSHSYDSLSIELLLNAIKDIPHLRKTIPLIIKELQK